MKIYIIYIICYYIIPIYVYIYVIIFFKYNWSIQYKEN